MNIDEIPAILCRLICGFNPLVRKGQALCAF